MIALYHNPRCSKSRDALAILRARGIEPEIIYYLDTPPSTAEIKTLLKKLGISARELLRPREDKFTELNLADESLSEAILIQAMVDHPKLIERPIALTEKKAVIGRPPENILQLL